MEPDARMKKNLALLIYSLGAGGAERVVSRLIPFLESRYNVTLVLMNDTVFYAIPEHLPVYYLERSQADEAGWKKLLKLPLLAFRYARFCRNHSIDVSLSFMNRPNYINTLSKIFGFKGRVLISERAMPSLQYGYGNTMSKINRYLIKKLYPKADGIMANSYGNAKDLQENFHIQTPIEILHNPCDTESIARASRKTAGGFPEDRAFTFITVGRMDEGKNHRLLIEAMARITDTKARLIIIGDGPLREALENLTIRLGMAERVMFAGRQENPYAWLVRSDCFVFGSNHEGFPNVVLEALACGLPVISTDCPSGPREILAPENGGAFGVLVPVGDTEAMALAMEGLIQDDTLREHYAKRATIRAQAFALEPFADQFMDYINAMEEEE